MSILSNERIRACAEELSNANLYNATAFGQAVKKFAKAIKEEIESTPEWRFQKNLNDALNVSVLKTVSGDVVKPTRYEVSKSINYQESCPRFDVNIIIKQTDLSKWLAADPRNTKANFKSRLLQVLDDLDIAKRSKIGQVTVTVQ